MKIFLKILLLLCTISTRAQMFEELEKEKNANDSKIVFTVASGIGLGSYSYDSNTAKSPTTSAYTYEPARTRALLLYFPVAATVLYKKNNLYIGGGIEFQGYSGKTRLPIDKPVQFQLLKVFGRLEYLYSSQKRKASAFFLQVGSGTALNAQGNNSGPLVGGALGMFTLYKINKRMNFLFGGQCAFDTFNTSINTKTSQHLLVSVGLFLGVRFGK